MIHDMLEHRRACNSRGYKCTKRKHVIKCSYVGCAWKHTSSSCSIFMRCSCGKCKKAPKNDDTSCTHRGERKRSHHRFCCTLVTPMRDPDRLMRSSLPHTWCQYSLSYQKVHKVTRLVHRKSAANDWFLSNSWLCTIYIPHLHNWILILQHEHTKERKQQHIYTNIFPTISTNTTLKKNPTDRHTSWLLNHPKIHWVFGSHQVDPLNSTVEPALPIRSAVVGSNGRVRWYTSIIDAKGSTMQGPTLWTQEKRELEEGITSANKRKKWKK